MSKPRPRIPRKIRLALTLLLFALLGLTTSIAIAWGATLWFMALSPKQQSFNLNWRIDRMTMTIPTSAGQSEAGNVYWKNTTDLPFPSWSQFHTPPRQIPQNAVEVAAGWPFYCLTYSTYATRTVGFQSFDQSYEGELYGNLNLQRFNPVWRNIQYLPRGLIVTNLLLDAVFWGVVWFFLFNYKSVWRLNLWLRRRVKLRCAWCGYDLQQLKNDRCPECGNMYNKPPALLAMPSLRMVVMLLVLLILSEAIFVVGFVSQRGGKTIHRAAILGDLEQLKAEIARGVDINTLMKGVSYEGNTPIMLAIEGGHGEIVDYLLDLGVDLKPVSKHRGNALTMAIRFERTDMVAKLLEAEAPVNTKTGDQLEPLVSAIDAEDLELFKTLIEHGADVNFRGGGAISPLDWLVISRIPIEIKEEMVRVLLEAGVNPKPPAAKRFGTPILIAIQTPLLIAVQRNELEIARMLLEAGEIIDFDTFAVAVAMEQLQPEMLQLLIEHGASFDMKGSWGQTLFFTFMGRNNDERIWLHLLERGVELDVVDNNGRTTLMTAVEGNFRDMVRFLLEHGADPTITTIGGGLREGKLTALDLAKDEEMKAILQKAVEKWEADHED